MLAAEAAHAGLRANHDETPARDRQRARGVAALAVAATVATAGGCSPFICGTGGNHNETAGRDGGWA
ncbi:MAG: hypothetical protein H0W25_11840 [Acidimicrobiia bacterium]|nr:hypothetical protein [Acidimicrobiia bacterium]